MSDRHPRSHRDAATRLGNAACAVAFALAAAVVLLCCLGEIAAAPSFGDCRAIKDDAERLKCYDAAAAAAFVDPDIAKAEAAIRATFMIPRSADFTRVVKRPGAVCGFVSAQLPRRGHTGPKRFVYLLADNKGWILDDLLGDPSDMQSGIRAAEMHCKGVDGF
jgi:hypothetical protein